MLTILQGDAIEQLRTLPDESVHCCVTSPPYWGLRDYGTAQWEGGEDGCDHVGVESRTVSGSDGKQYTNAGSNRVFSGDCKCGAKRIDSQLGLEKTPEEYVAKMVEVFREVRRVLRKDGTLWLNLGDSYAASSGTGGTNSFQPKQPMFAYSRAAPPGLKPKDLCGIPWRVAFALQADGWWLRSDIIWAKPNPMPESVTDRPTKSHEYLFLLTKSASYFYDAEAIKEKMEQCSIDRFASVVKNNEQFDPSRHKNASGVQSPYELLTRAGRNLINSTTRNKRSVWTVATAPYPEAHFATYPPDLIKPCILAGTSAKGCCAKCGSPWERVVEVADRPKPTHAYKKDGGVYSQGIYAPSSTGYLGVHGGSPTTKTIGWQPTCKCLDYERLIAKENTITPCTVLDPFAGSGTTGAVALELGRKAILIELNPKYVALIRQRCDITPGLALA